MALDFSRSRLKPFKHQMEDVQMMLDLPYFFIASEMRTGKSKIVIDGAQFLYEAGVIDRVLTIAPAPVRDVWYDPVLGELAKHLWVDVPVKITEFHARSREWHSNGGSRSNTKQLQWMVTNYEFIRSKNRLSQLISFCGPKTLLVLDESSFVKTWTAQQTMACLQLRRACGRVVLLNGTPISHSQLDLFSQGNILHPSILQCPFINVFKARYAVEEPVKGFGGKAMTTPYGRQIMTITGWKNLDDLQQRFAPYTVRRMQADCLDLPPKLDPVTLTATLTPETWRVYREMRDDLVVWLQNGNVATSSTAAIKSLRLSQITSGFLGGIEASNVDGEMDFENIGRVQEVGREKLDIILWFVKQMTTKEDNPKLVVWTRFRAELFRMVAAVREMYPEFLVAEIHGSQTKEDRLAALSLLKPETSPNKPVFVGGTFGTGSFGLDFTAAHTSVACSYDSSLGKFLQSADRVYGPGQIAPVAYFDVVAIGPKGQKTIDHHLVAARRLHEDIANWTTDHWIRLLSQE